ncbi:hypothetical protein LSAT2_031869 [Lamellibrachia satsuma]|nr:hypothetical protein LSAT2_031869 [Lamellibrachia satsuma]
MVQELAGYDSCAMHPATRQTPHNMNAYSYSGSQPQYSPDYGQYHQLTDGPSLQQTMAGSCTAGGWPGMYVGAPTAGPGRSPSGLDDWSAFMTTQTMQGHPNPGYGYRHGALSTMAPEMNYGQSTHSPLPVTSLPNLNHSPDTPGMMCSSPGSNVAMTGRQSRPPFDWMKKQAFQSPLVNVRRRTAAECGPRAGDAANCYEVTTAVNVVSDRRSTIGWIKRSGNGELVNYSKSVLFHGQAVFVVFASRYQCQQASTCRLNVAEIERTQREEWKLSNGNIGSYKAHTNPAKLD